MMNDLIMADPPWQFKVHSRDTGLLKSPDRHYRTMTTKELCALRPDAAPNAYLAMWVYDPMLPDAFKVAESWGFERYITVEFRWLKTTKSGKMNFGLGYHTRGGGCEEMLLFRRGKGLPVLRHNIRKEFFAPVREHSRKPDEVADWLIQLYAPKNPLEMFARTTRPGWQAMGDEIEHFRVE